MKFLLLPLSLMMLSGCTQMRRHVAQGSAHEANKLMDTAEIEWTALENMQEEEKAEETHVLVDTHASDVEIATAQGGHPDDAEEVEETPAPVHVTTGPTARPTFLKNAHTKRVKFWINYFTVKQRARFQRFLNNGAMYRPIIETILQSEGVPRELFFVGLIESGYYLGAHSHASAVGPWQFIRGTGSRYDLVINRDVDERRDIFKATQAAARYFKDLHGIFSSWELALAAYNAGEYGMVRRIAKHKTRDYYELSRRQLIPSETINYVPKVIAAMYVVENAEKYGFNFPKQSARLWQKTKIIPAPRNTSLKGLAQRLGVSHTLLVKLNPELRAGRTPKRVVGAYQLRVPADKQTEWMETLVAEAPAPSERLKEIESLRERIFLEPTWTAAPAALAATPAPVNYTPVVRSTPVRTHRVRRGETLSSIARQHKLSVSQLARFNDLTVKTKVRSGQRLSLARSSDKNDKVVAKASAPKRRPASQPIVYRLKNGETLTDVARWFGTSVSAIKETNAIKRGKSLHVGHQIKIPDTKKGTYTVRRGDYLIKVAQRFGLNQTALMKLNNLKRAHLIPGQRLVVNLE